MLLLDRVRQFVRRHDLAGRETRVVAALSGGSDSVALRISCASSNAQGSCASSALPISTISFATCGRRRRAVLSTRLPTSLGWPFCVDREDVAARARRGAAVARGRGPHARATRSSSAPALHFGADVVALGHTRDDQAETFLLRLMRGAGPRGSGGDAPAQRGVIRPLSTAGATSCARILPQRTSPYVDDESNDDVGIPRNRVRAELLPLLEDRFNPRDRRRAR